MLAAVAEVTFGSGVFVFRLSDAKVLDGADDGLSFTSQKTRRVALRLGIRAHARRGVGVVVGEAAAGETNRH
ncbi:MAG: hypothetical protein H0X66_05785 [Verrucomicrobia bacterium]|nr:hypothetical protein [Verrucomicrobiota bacterium]